MATEPKPAPEEEPYPELFEVVVRIIRRVNAERAAEQTKHDASAAG